MTNDERLATIRKSIEAETVSWAELVDLQALAEYIDPSDTLLLSWTENWTEGN